MDSQIDSEAPVARLRAKNQITLPEAIATKAGVGVGDRFKVAFVDGVIRLTPIRTSYFGALSGVWPEDWTDELRRDRDEWAIRERR